MKKGSHPVWTHVERDLVVSHDDIRWSMYCTMRGNESWVRKKKLVTRSPKFIPEGHAVHLENPASAQFPSFTLPNDDTRSSVLGRTNGRAIIDARHGRDVDTVLTGLPGCPKLGRPEQEGGDGEHCEPMSLVCSIFLASQVLIERGNPVSLQLLIPAPTGGRYACQHTVMCPFSPPSCLLTIFFLLLKGLLQIQFERR